MSPVENHCASGTSQGMLLWRLLQAAASGAHSRDWRRCFRTVQSLKIKQVLLKITAVPLTAETETEGRRSRDWSAQGLGGASKNKYNIYRN